MEVTDDWLMQNRTPNGGWNRAQIEALGVPWPLVHGWKSRVIGTDIPEATAHAFERLALEGRPPKSYRRNRALPNLDLGF